MNKEQEKKFHQSVGICRWLYNQYIAKNKEQYQLYLSGEIEKKDAFISAYSFDKYINNEVKTLREFSWINQCGSKARKKALVNAETAFKRFFKGQARYPQFKKKKNQDIKLYFPKSNKSDWEVKRNRIKIPTFSWVRLKEFGYIPICCDISSGTISYKAGKYFVAVLVEEKPIQNNSLKSGSIGIDLGIKEFATISNGQVFKNINKTERIQKLEKRLKRENRRLSRKLKYLGSLNNKGEQEPVCNNIQKQKLKIQKIYHKLTNIRTDYVNKTISSIVKQNPSSITIEDLDVRSMMKNKHLSAKIAKQKFYEFRAKLTFKCNLNNIELRIVDRWYPSSKVCSYCGFYKQDLKLSDRIFKCNNCDTNIDRDLNASLNLKNAKEYKIAN